MSPGTRGWGFVQIKAGLGAKRRPNNRAREIVATAPVLPPSPTT